MTSHHVGQLVYLLVDHHVQVHVSQEFFSAKKEQKIVGRHVGHHAICLVRHHAGHLVEHHVGTD